MDVEVGTIIAFCGLALALIFNVISTTKASKKDVFNSASKMTELLCGFNSLKIDIEEIKENTKDSGKKIEDLYKRVILLEYKTKDMSEKNKGDK